MDTNDQRMFDTILNAVKSLVPNYGVDSENKAIEFAVAGDPFNVIIDIKFLDDSGCYMLFSELGFKVPPENRANYAMEICRINFDQLALGSYDFDIKEGTTCFRFGQIYEDSLISEETLKTTIRLAYDTICKFNERLFNASRCEENAVTDIFLNGYSAIEDKTLDDTLADDLTKGLDSAETEKLSSTDNCANDSADNSANDSNDSADSNTSDSDDNSTKESNDDSDKGYDKGNDFTKKSEDKANDGDELYEEFKNMIKDALLNLTDKTPEDIGNDIVKAFKEGVEDFKSIISEDNKNE
ncbi:MAG: hypothetical protein K5656_04185 [Lachnospiraceae bacterium]|nr:hypothetical protein [Lachnospiraceae bacterium]